MVFGLAERKEGNRTKKAEIINNPDNKQSVQCKS